MKSTRLNVSSPHCTLPIFYAIEVPTYSLLITMLRLEQILRAGGTWQDFICLYRTVLAIRLDSLKTIHSYISPYSPLPSVIGVYSRIPFFPVSRGSKTRVYAPHYIWLDACLIASKDGFNKTKEENGNWALYCKHFRSCYYFTSDFSSLI